MDWKGFVLGELPKQDHTQAEEHLAGCTACRDEVERLRITEAALLSVAEEEIPQRIAFVSDKVFEPRWWQRIWNAGPALGFAGAAMLAVAILVHAFVPRQAEQQVAMEPAAIEALVEQQVAAEVARRVDTAVTEAVAAVEMRHAEETTRLIAAAEGRFEDERQAYIVALEEMAEVMKKREGVFTLARAEMQSGGLE